MPTAERSRAAAEEDVDPLKSRLAYHLRFLAEDATDPGLPCLERVALVRDRVARLREIRASLKGSHVRTV